MMMIATLCHHCTDIRFHQECATKIRKPEMSHTGQTHPVVRSLWEACNQKSRHYHYLLVGLREPDSRLISEEGH